MKKDSVTSLIDAIAGNVAAAAARTARLTSGGQYSKAPDPSDSNGEMFMILSPTGGWVATTLNEFQADSLLTHLNR